MKVKDIMTKEVMKIHPEINAREALEFLLSKEISGLPVIDEKGKLLGMFTEKDVLRFVLPGYIEQVGRFVYENNARVLNKKVSELKNVTVKELMRKDVVTIAEDASLYEAAHLILTQKVRRIPVLDKERKVCGILAREDVVKAFAKGLDA